MKYLILLLALCGCSSFKQRDYQCFRVIGPIPISSTAQSTAEDFVREMDMGGKNPFIDADFHWECRELSTPSHYLDNRK